NSRINGALEGLDKIQIELGDYALGLDLSRALRIELRPLAQRERPVEYSLAVRIGADEIARTSGLLPVEGAVARRPGAGQFKLTPYQGEAKTVELPDTISDVALAGGGRFVLLHLSKARKIAVYDVEQAKIARFLSLSSENSFIAAGLDKLLVLSPTDSVI